MMVAIKPVRMRRGRWLRRLIPDLIRQRRLVKYGLATGIVIFLIGTIGVVTYAQAVEQLQSESRENLETTAELASLELNNWLGNRESQARDLGRDRRVQIAAGDTETEILARAFLTTRLDAGPTDVTAFHITERLSREVLASTEPEREGESFDQPWLDVTEMAFEDGVYVSAPYERKGTHRIGFVTETDNHLLVMETNLSKVIAQFRDPTEGSFFTLVDRDGTIRGSDRADLVGHSYARGQTWRALSAAFGVETTYVDGVSLTVVEEQVVFGEGSQHLLAATAVPDSELLVVVHTPQAEAFTLADAIARNILVLVAVSMFALAVVGVGLVRQTVRELNQLGEQAQELEQGNLDTELDTHLDDEIGELYESFDEMRVQLRERITEAEQLNDQLEVTDRLLRHNLHNDLNVVQLNAELVKQRHPESSSEARKIIEVTESLLEKAEKKRRITELVSLDSDRTTVELVSLLEQTIETARNQYPEATFSLDSPARTEVEGTNHVSEAFEELLENAVAHSDQETPTVEITVLESASGVVVRIADTGPPIDSLDRKLLAGELNFTQLDHASGIGLWLVYWIVRQAGGELRYEPNDPRGNIIIVELPRP
jgi:signal transduction histidine kinase